MPQATQAPAPAVAGEFCWFEINTTDLDKTKAFYGSLLGWTFEDVPMPGMTYTMLHKDGKAFGGVMHMTDPHWKGVPSHWMSYICVDDVDAAAKKVAKLGGSVCVPPTDIPNVGRFSVVNDPDGAVFSLFTSASEMSPLPDAIVWHELMFKNAENVRPFYKGLFGWTTEDMDMGPAGTYTVWNHNGKGFAGSMDISGPEFEAMRPAWMNYIGVDSVDATVARATKLGAQVIVPPTDIPGDKGRIATVHDPTGAEIAFYQPGSNPGG